MVIMEDVREKRAFGLVIEAKSALAGQRRQAGSPGLQGQWEKGLRTSCAVEGTVGSGGRG